MLKCKCSKIAVCKWSIFTRKRTPNSLQSVKYQNLLCICSDSLQGDNIKVIAKYFLFQIIPISVPIKSMKAILCFKAELLW